MISQDLRSLCFVNFRHQLRQEGPLTRWVRNRCELPVPAVLPLTLLWKCSTVSACGWISHSPGQRPFLPQLVPGIDETEIVGAFWRSRESIPAQNQPPWVPSLCYGDTHTAWDHPEPIRWRHTVPCGALEP